jgi:hypothetical protein
MYLSEGLTKRVSADLKQRVSAKRLVFMGPRA